MNADLLFPSANRRTSADEVFERLRSDIVTLRLPPGTKLSEVEIARQSEVSRQPVREAFIRLNNMNLLLVRPQKATIVRKISMRDIMNTRFIRTAVEVEVVRRACAVAGADVLTMIEKNLKNQRVSVNRNDADLFHNLDYEFHYLICLAAECEFAAETIAEKKAHVDRLCMLSLANEQGMRELLDDHTRIFEALKDRDEETMVELTRLHLSRLDQTVVAARELHPDYFED
ncbi:GntR family transcriptional regulator [Rhodobacteraceae bacterium NNCM2]|nr:GntR family transcriptional regulator [Coraliihabitans acroporae]